jgi:hypothetical protein
MKNILSLALCIACSVAYGQNNFFLQPQIGVGGSNTKEITYSGTQKYKSVLAYDVRLDVGYDINNIVITSGIGYMRTGYKLPFTLTDPLGNVISSTYIYWYFNHLMLPLHAGYKLKPGKKLAILPTIGTDFSYNISAQETPVKYLSTKKVKTISAAEFDRTYNRLSVFGFVQVSFEYNISSKLSITCAPAFDYMFTNLLQVPANNYYTARQHNYAYVLNAGIIWHLEKEAHVSTPSGVNKESR